MNRNVSSFASAVAAGFIAVVLVAAPASHAAAPCDPFFLSPIFASYPEDASGGSLSGSFNVWLGAGCTWLAATDASWIHITGGATGTGQGGPGFSGTVSYEVAPNTGGQQRFAKIYVRAANTTAFLEHTVYQAGWVFQQTTPIHMTAINPTFGEGGTVIRVTGSGFDADFNALAVGLVINPTTIVPMKTIQGGLPDLQIGVISSDVGTAGSISVTRGRGCTGIFKPAFADIVLREPAWVWTGNAESVTAVSEQPFTLRPTTPPPGTRWFFSGSPSNGVLSAYLTGAWSPSNRVSIDVFAENPSLHLHRAAQLHGIEFPGGSLLDCAQRLCDTLRCAFTQLGMVAVNCEVELGGAVAPVVKLTLSFPEGPITRGGLMICTEPATPPLVPVITSFSPSTGGEGTQITIAGRNLGSNPRNLSAAILNGASEIPLQVISANETQAVAVVGTVQPRAVAGPIQLTLGDGNRALVGFEHGDIQQPVFVGTWYQAGAPSATSRDSFTPQPPPGLPPWPKCYFSERPSFGQVCLTLSDPWPTPAKVSISAGLHDTRAGKGRDIQVNDVIFQGAIIQGNPPIIDPLNVLECAYRICDVIGSGSLQGGGFLVNCSVDLVSPGVAQICLSMVDGFVDQGHLNVCVQPADYVPASRYPAITDFHPKDGGPGDAVTIIGRNFLGGPDTAPNPDNVSVSILNGSLTIPLQVIQASDTQIIAVLDEVPPNARPGHLRVTLGRGSARFFALPAPFTEFKDGTWSWSGSDASAESSQDFIPQQRALPPGTICLFSGGPVNGELIALYPFTGDPLQSLGPFPNPAYVEVDFEAVSDCVPGGVKLKKSGVVLVGPNYVPSDADYSGSPGGAASLFDHIWWDLIFWPIIDGGWNPPNLPNVGAKVVNGGEAHTAGPAGFAGIHTTSLWPWFNHESGTGAEPLCLGAGWQITAGHLNVCIRPAKLYMPPHIIDVFPKQAQAGDLFTLTGDGFGFNPRDLSLVLMNGNNSIPLQVLTANDTQLTARLGPVPTNAQPGPLKLSLGAGQEGFYAPNFTDVKLWQPAWGWHQTGASPFALSPIVTPVPNPAPPGRESAWYWSENPNNGVLQVHVPPGDWPLHSSVQVSLHAEVASRNIAVDLRIDVLRWTAVGTQDDYLRRIADAIQELSLRLGGVPVTSQNRAGNLEVSLSAGQITAGRLGLGIRPATLPPTITDLQPRSGHEGDRITVIGNDLIPDPPNAPNPLDYALMVNGAPGAPLEVLSVTRTSLVARLGPVAPGTRPGPLVLALGKGRQGSFLPSYPDIVPGSNVATWVHSSITVTSAVPFTPMPATPSNGLQWSFSGPPSNGMLFVTLSNNWPTPAWVWIEARAENDALHLGRKLHAEGMLFNGGGTTMDCARRLADVLMHSYRPPTPPPPLDIQGAPSGSVQFGISVSGNADGSVQLGLSAPGGLIEWGHLAIGVGPVPPPPRPPAPEISRVSPDRGGEGTLVTIFGRNFLGGPDTLPDDLSVVIREGNGAIPLEVLSATDSQIEARLGTVPPGARGGPLVVAIGSGKRGLATPRSRGVWPLSPAWAWTSSGPSTTSTATFTPQPGVPTQTWFFSGPPVSGKLRVAVPVSAWTTDAVVRVSLRAQGSNQAVAFDSGSVQLQDRAIRDAAFAVSSIPVVGRIIAALLAVIAAVISLIGTLIGEAIGKTAEDGTDAAAGRNLNYEVTLAPGGSNVEVVVSWPTGPIDWGCFNICLVRPAPPAPLVITDIQPRSGTSGDMVRISGRGFGENPDHVLASVRNGTKTISLRALSCTETQIVAQVGLVPSDAQPGPIMVWRGFGRSFDPRDTLTPAGITCIEQVLRSGSQSLSLGSRVSDPATAVWVWGGLAPGGVSGNVFASGYFACQPTYPGGVAVGSESGLCIGAVNGAPNKLENYLQFTSSEDARFKLLNQFQLTLELQVHNDALGIHRSLYIPESIQPVPPDDYSTAISSDSEFRILRRICELIHHFLPGQVNCSPYCPICVNFSHCGPMNGARIELTLPEGLIEYGSLRFCIADLHNPVAPAAPIQSLVSIQSGSSPMLELRVPRIDATGYQLEATDDLLGSPPGHVNWVPINLPLRATDTELQMTLPNDPSQRRLFFRLNKPATGR